MCVLYNVLSLAVLSVLCMGAGSRVGAAASLHPTLRSPLLKRIANSTLRVDSNSTMQMDSSASCALGPGIESHQAVQGPIWPSQAYKSSPYRPPEMYITKYNQPLSSGLIFIAPYTSAPGLTNGPLIMTDAGQLVWNGPTSQAANFRVQTYRGKNILTYWRSSTAKGPGAGRGYGEVVFLDTSYNEILTVCPNIKLLTSDGSTPACGADFHESFITPQDTILVTAVNVIAISNGFFNRRVWVYDSLFYELDPESGEVLFRWSALDHIPISQSQMPRNGRGGSQSAPYDWFHMNSVVTVGDDYLVNSRHTFSTYLINRSGDVVWTLQGQTGGDFGALPANGAFSWQHFARPHNVTDSSMSISYFDNANGNPSVGLELQLSLPPNKATAPKVLQHLIDPHQPLRSFSQGSFEFLDNGNIFVDYGLIPVLKEFGSTDISSTGGVRWTAAFGPYTNNIGVVESYRGYKNEWHGTPSEGPSLFVEKAAAGCGTAYASWNGATDVSHWIVFWGSHSDIHFVGYMGQEVPSIDAFVGNVTYMGFETAFTVAGPCVQVAAVTTDEIIHIRSDVICMINIRNV